MPNGPEIVPSPQEIADEERREAERKRLRLEEVASETSTPTELLARIEPEGQEFYDITKRLSNALLLSIAISTKRQADAPEPVVGTAAFDPKEFFERASPKDKPKRKKAKSKKRKVR